MSIYKQTFICPNCLDQEDINTDDLVDGETPICTQCGVKMKLVNEDEQ